MIAKADGTLTIEASTVRLASFGVRVLDIESVIGSAVVADASCHDLHGPAGVDNIFVLARDQARMRPTPPAALADQPCAAAVSGGTATAGSVATEWDLQAAFVLATRYADTR